jgi:hypothetical protein
MEKTKNKTKLLLIGLLVIILIAGLVVGFRGDLFTGALKPLQKAKVIKTLSANQASITSISDNLQYHTMDINYTSANLSEGKKYDCVIINDSSKIDYVIQQLKSWSGNFDSFLRDPTIKGEVKMGRCNNVTTSLPTSSATDKKTVSDFLDLTVLSTDLYFIPLFTNNDVIVADSILKNNVYTKTIDFSDITAKINSVEDTEDYTNLIFAPKPDQLPNITKYACLITKSPDKTNEIIDKLLNYDDTYDKFIDLPEIKDDDILFIKGTVNYSTLYVWEDNIKGGLNIDTLSADIYFTPFYLMNEDFISNYSIAKNNIITKTINFKD